MRRIIGIIIILLSFGCSYNTDFYIINTSDKDLIIEYKLNDSSAVNIFIDEPEISLFDKNLEIVNPKVKKSIVKTKENKFRIKLKSNQGILLGYDINFYIKNNEDYQKLNSSIEELKVYDMDRIIIKSDSTNTADLFEEINRHLVIIDIEKASR